MKHNKLLICFIFILIVQSFLFSCILARNQNIPRLPLYIGKGYDILLGNPLSAEGIDPGFQHDVFQFSYTKNQTTEDDKFIIPDGVEQRKTTACSFSTQITQYRGTQSYQSNLKTKAQISGGYEGVLFKASFTASTSYQKLQNQTLQENMTLTHASAECQCYELSLDIFSPGNISKNFWDGVMYSYNTQNWNRFIDQFGTHYIYQVIMGGRAIQQIQYSFKSSSDMKSLNIDINIAAKASFAKFYGDTSFDYQKYQTQIKYAESLSQSIHQIYIGGQPPKTGKIMDWQQMVIHDPMPIFYRMLPLSDLFMFYPDKSFNYKQATTQFLSALDSYCAHKNCKQPTADRPAPKPSPISVITSTQYGGNGGGPDQWHYQHPTINFKKVFIRCTQWLFTIQIQLSDGISSVFTPEFGAQGGTLRDPWQIPKGQFIIQVQYRYSDRINSIGFITNKGNRSPRYGGTGGMYALQTFPQGYRIIGVVGRHGSWIDKLGFVLGKTQYINGQEVIDKKYLILNDS